MDTKKIGSLIARKRREQNMTQVQLGELLGVTGKTVSRWENGNYMPDLSLLTPLCSALHLTLEELLAGEEKEGTSEAEAKEAMARYERKLRAEKRRLLETVLTLAVLAAIAAVVVWWAASMGAYAPEDLELYLIWTLIGAGAVALICFGMAVYHVFQERRLARLEGVTVGTVTGLVRSHLFRNDVYGDVPGGVLMGWGVAQGEQYWGGMLKMRIPPWFPCVRYEAEGKVYEKLTGEGVWKDTWDIGQRTTVQYKTGAPGICYVEGDPSYRNNAGLCAILGVVFTVITLAAAALLCLQG